MKVTRIIKEQFLHIRIDGEDKKRLESAARKARKPLSAWIRATLMESATSKNGKEASV